MLKVSCFEKYAYEDFNPACIMFVFVTVSVINVMLDRTFVKPATALKRFFKLLLCHISHGGHSTLEDHC